MTEVETTKLVLFKGKQIRKTLHQGEWWFSVVDVIRVLTDSTDPRKYWNKLAQRLREEGSEVVTKCHQLKFMATDGKYYDSDAADTETMFRLIQSIP